MKIIGLNCGHNATACLSINGKIVTCVSEERLTRKKNFVGFPSLALDQVYKLNQLHASDIDSVVIATSDPYSHQSNLLGKHFNGSAYTHKISRVEIPYSKLKQLLSTYHQQSKNRIKSPQTQKLKLEILNQYSRLLNIPKDKISLINHHLLHAFSTIANLTPSPWLIFTLDAEGDHTSATINLFDGSAIKPISHTSNADSLGYLYLAFTQFLDMKPNEHEYKVMGLAPYGQAHDNRVIVEEIRKLIKLNKNKDKFIARFPLSNTEMVLNYLETNFRGKGYRFDMIASAIQQVTEELIVDWVTSAVKKHHISQIALSGGVFLNVKANKLLMEHPAISKIWITPSPSDESLAIGACHYQFHQLTSQCPKPIQALYLGPSYQKQASQLADKIASKSEFKISRKRDIEKTIAFLLAKHQIVARFKGPMEWGARALGNRSILARPDDPSLIFPLNKAIKLRDFWMPFAPSILSEDMSRYVLNSSKLKATYMVMAYDTTDLGKRALSAAIQPYDQTTRPQEVIKSWNPDYHYLISEFKKITGIGAILNTSFNLHGYPIVCTPDDAFYVFQNSGLKYLALEDYLIEKN